VGRGKIQGESHQILLQFVARARETLEAEPLSVETPMPVKRDDDALRVAPLVFTALWEAVVAFFRRLLGRAGARGA
jgi:hypothetical protein